MYKDINKVLYNGDIDRGQCEIDNLMREKPNFNKRNGGRKVYQRKPYIILECGGYYIVFNTNKKFEEGHTHVGTFSYAKSIIDLCIRMKYPNRPNKRLINSLIRVSNDDVYIDSLRCFK